MRASSSIAVVAFLLAAFMAAANANADSLKACSASSPPHRAALVELYTSEGCNSCPPADNWLSQIDHEHDANTLVPLALHVDYWDSVAWKDRFAEPAFTERQQRLTSDGGGHVVYTPEVFVGGQELRGWSSASGFASRVAKLNSQAPLADIHIDAHAVSAGNTAFSADIRARPALDANAVAYAAVYEDRLHSDVRGGENQGVTLHHDRVVRRWIGPVAVVDGHAHIAGDYAGGNQGVVAFVEDPKTGEVLQVAELAGCGG